MHWEYRDITFQILQIAIKILSPLLLSMLEQKTVTIDLLKIISSSIETPISMIKNIDGNDDGNLL